MQFSKYLTIAISLLVAAAYFFIQLNNTTPTGEPERPSTVSKNSQSKDSQWEDVVEYANAHLPKQGELVMNPEGFGYLKVDDSYIKSLFPMLGLENEGFRPPPYFRRKDSLGAHISVFYVDEHVRPSEVGQTFHFDLNDITIVKTKNASYVVLQVQSPELENLRKEYGLSPKLFGHDFHISLGKKDSHHNGNRHRDFHPRH